MNDITFSAFIFQVRLRKNHPSYPIRGMKAEEVDITGARGILQKAEN